MKQTITKAIKLSIYEIFFITFLLLIFYGIYLLLQNLKLYWLPSYYQTALKITLICSIYYAITKKIRYHFTNIFQKEKIKYTNSLNKISKNLPKIHTILALEKELKNEFALTLNTQIIKLHTKKITPKQSLISLIPIISPQNKTQIATLEIKKNLKEEEEIYLKSLAKELAVPIQNIILLDQQTQQFQELQKKQIELIQSEKEKVINIAKQKYIQKLSTLILEKITIQLEDIKSNVSKIKKPPLKQESIKQVKKKCQTLYKTTTDFLTAESKENSYLK